MITAEDNDAGMKRSYSEFGTTDARTRMWGKGASVVEQCDMYGALCGMAGKRGALEDSGDWRVERKGLW
jgi:hypothetical protein